jgi:hypothetical protein
MRPEEVKRRIEAGQSATIIDVRNPKAWASSPIKIAGAMRGDAEHFHSDPGWRKDRLSLAY